MHIKLDIPWRRYALIAELAKRLEDKSPQFGKTALQKMVYILQDVYGIDCGYDFELYTYGPFTSQLLQDLDLVEHMGGVSIRPVLSSTGGYEIQPGKQADLLREKGADFLNDRRVSKAISSLADEFGDLWAKDLELRSTIVYVERDHRRQGKRLSSDEIIHVVKQVKPKFTEMEIREAVEEMKFKKYIDLSS